MARENKEVIGLAKEIFLNKKFQIVLTAIIFLIILVSSTNIRLSNLPTLKDQTTGEYLSNDLDSLYFSRVAETELNLGQLPKIDELRSPGYNVGWIPELIDNYLVWNYKFLKVFNTDITFNYATTISAPVFFVIGLILFFILCLLLTKSKTTSLLASAFLAYAPAFLFRSISGFYDHDHVGVFAIFALIIVSFLSLKYCEKNWVNSTLFGVVLGFFTALVLASWGGGVTFVLVLLPLTLLLHYMFNVENKNKFLLFYLLWIVFAVLFTPLLGSKAEFMYGRFLDSQGILVLFVFGFALIDSLVVNYKDKLKFIKGGHVSAYSLGLTALLGIIGLILIGKNPLSLFKKAWATLIYPFFGEFGGRLSSTVAENAQPYLTDLINQATKLGFWFFVLGILFLCWNFSKDSKNMVNRFILSGSMMVVLFAIIFSRFSSTSLLNGENLISQGLYLLGGLVFLAGLSYVYSKEKFKISIESILLFSIALTVAINARAAIRSFFLITPFIALIGAYGILEFLKKTRDVKDDTFKLIARAIGILVIILVFIFLFWNPLNNTPGIYQSSTSQAKYVGPSVNVEWQNMMGWVRNNTGERDIFVHWWDYGYFVQTLGERPTVTDGGHSGGDSTDHYIGRYILTTPNPSTAYSFMKTWNVSYLLIDPTEVGKYGAFSKIGSNDSWDRLSTGIVAGVMDEKQTQETAKGITYVYQVGTCVDGDINYKDENISVFLPGISLTKQQSLTCNAYLAGVILETQMDGALQKFKQPIGVFIYNNKQYRLPLKNIFYQGKMQDFGSGVDSVVYLIPSVDAQKGQLNGVGAIIYLSPRTFNSLLGRLYILNDYYKQYTGLILAHNEDDPAVSYFKQQAGNVSIGDFVYYQGLRAPLRIWKVNYPADTQVHKEFLSQTFTFGGMDKYF